MIGEPEFPYFRKYEDGSFELLESHDNEPYNWVPKHDGIVEYTNYPVHYVMTLTVDDFEQLHEWLDQNCPSWYYLELPRISHFIHFEERQRIMRRQFVAKQTGFRSGMFIFCDEKEACLARLFYGS